MVTSKAAIEAGIATPSDPVFPESDGFQIPGTSTKLGNFGGEVCGGTLEESLIISCNTTFAPLGYELGNQFAPAMDQCGIDERAADRPGTERGRERRAARSARTRARFALAGIGQGDVFTSPLQMALIAAGIANGGVIKQPHVVKEIQNSDGEGRAHDRAQGLEDVHVADHCADAHQHDGAGRERRAPAPPRRSPGSRSPARPAPRRPASRARRRTRGSSRSRRPNAPRYAVAVIVEHGGSFGNEATGGAVAAPIAKQVLQNLLATNP